MVFSSLTFIYFLPIIIILYAVLKKHRNIVLLIASLFFYAFGEPVYILLLILSSTIDYSFSKFIAQGNKPKLFLILSIIMNLLLLGFFKYSDFLIMGINDLFVADIAMLELPLPIGISFYTFQTLSYTIDVYRRRVDYQKDYLSYLMYVTMFPQLIAGPIVRYKDVEKQITKREFNYENLDQGFRRFIKGLSKKVLLADQFALIYIGLINSGSVLGNWLAVIAFGLQIYFDFSGYSDMAIGIAKMFGFDLLENFNYPYLAKSVSEFWRRWHISLGNWFRDYLYIPLGGNRGKILRTIVNLLIVWSLTGLWHGASYNFLIWGLYFSFFIIIEKLIPLKVPSILSRIYLLLVVSIGWIIFSIESIDIQTEVLSKMFGGASLIDFDFINYFSQYWIIIVIGIVACLPIKIRKVKYMDFAYHILLLMMSLSFIVTDSFSPFIYFRF